MNFALNKHSIYLKMALRGIMYSPSFATARQLIKYYSAWNAFLDPARNSVIDKQPWLSFAAIDFIKEIIRPDMVVFEYGSGGSTLFWAEHTRRVISIEHDEVWSEKMKRLLSKQNINNVEYHFIPAERREDFITKEVGKPSDYISTDENYRDFSFKTYASSIDRFPDDSFDIILVDGRARPSCIGHAIPKLKRNGYLVVDNTERGYYLAPFNFGNNEWELHRFFGPVPYSHSFSETSIIKKR